MTVSSQFIICFTSSPSLYRAKHACPKDCSRYVSSRQMPKVTNAGAIFIKTGNHANMRRLPRILKCLKSPWTYEILHELEREDPEKISTKGAAEIERLRSLVKARLDLVDEGDINASAYDTAWVALVEDVQGGTCTPQFPTSLLWISDNQLPDGSWGDKDHFSAYDRLVSTLACANALKKWNMNPQQTEKGLKFVKENIRKLEDEEFWHMSIGFEILFPALIDMARKLEMDVPHDDDPIMQQIYESRAKKLERIPKDVLQTVHTSLLFTLEGLTDLDWEKLMKLQSPDGSFLNSLSSTAFALARTQDTKCLNFIEKIVERFNGGVPYIFPVDLFTRMWAVDRLQRLGVFRYFKAEFQEFMSYVYRHWSDRGLYTARGSPMQDVDDTAMGWRLLRLYGYDVSPDALQHFRNGDKFFTFAFESIESVTTAFNLYRASEILFPSEKILEDAKSYSSNFLKNRRSKNQIFDKWLVCKDLPGEVAYALDVPWYASLSRIETRFYLDQYGGGSDRWIGKVFYRMDDVNNDDYLDLGRMDYNYCQALHKLEWNDMQTWYNSNLQKFGISTENALVSYFIAAASIFEPERSKERLAWAKTSILIEILSNYLKNDESFHEQKEALLNEIDTFTDNSSPCHNNSCETEKELLAVLLRATIKDLSLETPRECQEYVHGRLCVAWKKWLMAWKDNTERCPEEAQLLVRSIIACAGHPTKEEMLSLQPHYKILSDLTNKICHQLGLQPHNNQVDDESINNHVVDKDMQELVEQVLSNSRNGVSSSIKQTFLIVAKSFYYTNFFSRKTIISHIDKVLFKSVL